MGKKKCKNIIIKQGLDGWVMTYGDMMSLLLTFFVLIVSFSSMQETKFNQAAASLADAFGVLATPESVIEFNTPIVPNHNPESEEAEVLYEVRNVEKMLLEEGIGDKVEVEITPDGVLIKIDSQFMFESGGAGLTDGSKKILSKLSSFFRKFPYPLTIEGHTDSLPINTSKFPSNWELSAHRAVTVARFFQETGIAPERIAATGYGEFRPVADNETRPGRDKNRRVEIFLKLKKEDLIKGRSLPFAKKLITAPAKAAPAEEIVPVRPIINPVTGRLGGLPIQKP